MLSIPKLEISREPVTSDHYDPTRTHSFRYRSKHHQELPHVVKFSGGRSSGMLLFTLIENGLLKRNRDDVVIFNNTSIVWHGARDVQWMPQNRGSGRGPRTLPVRPREPALV